MNADVSAALADLQSQRQTPIDEQLLQFGIDLSLGEPAKIVYKLPTEKVTWAATILGHAYTFTAEVVNGELKIIATPSS